MQLFIGFFFLAASVLSYGALAENRVVQTTEYGKKESIACGPRKSGDALANRFFKQYKKKSVCKKVTFTCQEENWHVPEIWRIVIDKQRASEDTLLGVTSNTWTLVTGVIKHKYHRLEKMHPWVFVPVEKNDDIQRTLVMHQEKLTGAMVIKKQVFDKQSGYQDKEYRYFCRSSLGEYEQ